MSKLPPQNRLIVIDGHAVLHRAWHALPPLTTADGTIVSGAYGFVMTLMRAIRELKPTHVAVTFDLKGPTFRHQAYDDYKGTREKKPDELYAQVPIIREVLTVMNIPVYAAEGYEADDAIGTIVVTAEKQDPNIDSIIVTGDLDTLQLVDDNTRVYTMRKGISDMVIYDAAAVRERFSLEPNQMVDYKALRGDQSDNIPGVKGVGEKTASQLIGQFGSVLELYGQIDEEKDGLKENLRQKLLAGRDAALQALDLCRIRLDVPIDFRLADAELRPFDVPRLLPLLEKYEFQTVIRQLQMEQPTTSVPQASEISDVPPTPIAPAAVAAETLLPTVIATDAAAVAGWVDKLAENETVAWRSVAAADVSQRPQLLGLATAQSGLIITGLDKADVVSALRQLLLRPLRIVTHDAKSELLRLSSLGVAPGFAEDAYLAAYLLQPGERRLSPAQLAERYLQQSWPEATADTTISPAEQLRRELSSLLPLAGVLAEQLRTNGLERVYREIELPLAPVLARMQNRGVALDVKYLAKLSQRFGEKLETLAGEAFRLAGTEFNLNSPSQVKEVLFDRLLLSSSGIKKTQKGKELSTAAAELEKLRDLHPIVGVILEWRELAKLKSTYVDALPELVGADGRLHANFNQAVTTTGRLSSSDPNLQNIPTAETEAGRLVRQAFVPADGYRLLAADYSQIELRVAAQLANEPVMIEAFRKGEDIHWRTAVEMFGEAEATEKRRLAKVINFGILYGMGANRLSASAGIPLSEAREYIDRYFAVHQGIAAYVTKMKEAVATDGYVESLFGRRRIFPKLSTLGQRERAEAERQAVNMPLQGTSADMTKLAMIAVDRAIVERWGSDANAPLRMTVQVHDELVFEVRPEFAAEAAELVRKLMSEVMQLVVPIEVKVSLGDNWGEMTELKQ